MRDIPTRSVPERDTPPGSTPPDCETLPVAEALAQLRPRMWAVALRIAPNAAAAEDIVQSAYEKAIRKLDQFRGQARFSTWLHRIVVNEALMWLRSERRRAARQVDAEQQVELEERDPSIDPQRALLSHERIALVRRGIRALPDIEREVLQRCALDGASYEQFSAETGIDPAAAKSRAFRARRRLRDLLGASL